MFFSRKVIPEVKIEQWDFYLSIKCIVKNNCVSRMKCTIAEDNSILICDIIHEKKKYYNKGFGSLMMENLISFAENKGYILIKGNLSIVDLDHKDKLHHFYEKYGFVIKEYSVIQDCYYGEISKNLIEIES